MFFGETFTVKENNHKWVKITSFLDNYDGWIEKNSIYFISENDYESLNSNIVIKNVASSSYADPTGSFQKTTYISSIGIYDEDKNLIGVAKVATPVKKTENREFTFKLKLDI